MDNIIHEFFVSEVDTESKGKHKRYFLFSESKYQSIVSLNCFFFGKKKRNWNGKLLYCVHNVFEIIELVEKYNSFFDKPYYDAIKSNTCIKCDGLYDFYKKIGYNRKTKKYE